MSTWKLTPDTGQISGSHTNLPLVTIPSDIEMGAITLAEAQSSRFYTDATLLTEVPREVVSANELHSKQDADSSLELYVDYDGVRSDYAVTATYGRNAVWSDYLAVYHFEDNPSGGSLTDSTGNGRNGTAEGSMTSGDKISGPFGSAWDFDGSNDSVELDSYATDFETSQLSVTAWALSENADIRDYEAIFSLQQGGGPFSKLWVGYQGGLYFRTASANDHALGISTAADDGSWHHFAATIESNSQLIYLDASVNASNNSPRNATAMDSVNRAAISKDWYTDNQRFRKGQVASVRIRDDILAANRLTTEYNNQKDNAAFWVAEDVGGGGGGPTYTVTCDTAAFTLTGQAAETLVAYAMAADNAAFSQTASTTDILHIRLLSADVGAFTLTGQDADTLANYSFALSTGEFALAGTDSSLAKAYRLSLETGTFDVSGSDVAFSRSYALSAGTGAFNLAGIDANLSKGLVFSCETGAFTLDAQNADLRLEYVVTAQSADFTLSGEPAAFLAAYGLAVEPGSFQLAGNDSEVSVLSFVHPFCPVDSPFGNFDRGECE